MKLFRRMAAALLSVAMLLSLMMAAVPAAVAAEPATVYDAIYQGLSNSETRINLSAFRMSEKAVRSEMQRVLYSHPELFYVGYTYAYEQNTAFGYLTVLVPTYTLVGGALVDARRTYTAALNLIADQVDSEWSDVEKVLFVHDYLAVTFAYDTVHEKDDLIYDAYRLATQKIGVCQAYMLLFRGVMDRLGIETDYAYSDEMGHVWTVVKLDGVWYHLDVTWDDATPDRIGRVSHLNFLLSDTALQAESMGTFRHYNYTCDHTCDSTRFDTSAQWIGVNSPMVNCGGKWYYLRNNGLYTGEIPGGEEEKVLNLPDYWLNIANPGYYWPGTFSGLAAYDGKLYFNKPYELCVYDPETGKVETLTTAGRQIYGCRLQQDPVTGVVSLDYQLSDDPNGTNIEICTYLLHQHEWDKGTVTTAPTCEAEGVRTYTCRSCDAVKTETVEKIPHEWGEWVPDEDGGGAAHTCKNCPEREHHDHEWDEDTVLTPAACDTAGEMEYTCTVCGAKKTGEIPAKTHEYTPWEADIAAKKVRRSCKNCTLSEERDFDWNGPLSEEDLLAYTPVTAGAYRAALSALTGALEDGETGYEDLLAALSTLTGAEEALTLRTEGLLGDADGDGKVTTTDARLTLQFAAGKIDASALNTTVADVDTTPGVSTTDARLILQFAAKKIDRFPKELAA